MGGITIFILAAEAAAIFSLVNYLEKETASVSEKRESLAAVRAQRFSIVSLKSDFDKAKNYFDAMENALPDENNIYLVVDKMESLGRDTGNQVAIQVNASQILTDQTSGSRFVSFSGSLNGTYQSLRRYLRNLSNNFIFAEVDSVSLAGNGTIDNVSSASISGKIFLK